MQPVGDPPTKICDIGPFTGVYTKGKLMARELEAVVAFLVQGLIQSRIYHVVEAGLNSWFSFSHFYVLLRLRGSWAPIPNWGAMAKRELLKSSVVMVWLLVGWSCFIGWHWASWAVEHKVGKMKWEWTNYVVQSWPPTKHHIQVLNTDLKNHLGSSGTNL